jgi:outer membrane protein assembly factor BamB
MVFLSSGFDRPSTMAIKVDGRGDVTDTHIAWTNARSAPNTPSMLLDGKELYFVSDSGIATCADALTGTVHWSERLGGNFSASPILAGGRLYFQNEEGVGFVVQAGKTYQLLSRNDLKERTLASPSVDGDALYLRGEKNLFRIETR